MKRKTRSSEEISEAPAAKKKETVNPILNDKNVDIQFKQSYSNPKVISRRKIKTMNRYGNIILKEFPFEELVDPVIIVAIPNDDEDSSLMITTAQLIIKQLELNIVAEITSNFSKPSCVVEQGISSSSIRIHGNRNVLILTSERVIESSEMENDIVEMILDFGKRQKCKLILSFKAIKENPNYIGNCNVDTKVENLKNMTKKEIIKGFDEAKKNIGKEKVWYATNDQEFSDTMTKMNCDSLDVFILGIAAGLLNESCYSDIPISCLFYRSNLLQSTVPYSSISIISVISKFLVKEDYSKIHIDEMKETLEFSRSNFMNDIDIFHKGHSSREELNHFYS
eukprot:gene6411-10418_t